MYQILDYTVVEGYGERLEGKRVCSLGRALQLEAGLGYPQDHLESDVMTAASASFVPPQPSVLYRDSAPQDQQPKLSKDWVERSSGATTPYCCCMVFLVVVVPEGFGGGG